MQRFNIPSTSQQSQEVKKQPCLNGVPPFNGGILHDRGHSYHQSHIPNGNAAHVPNGNVAHIPNGNVAHISNGNVVKENVPTIDHKNFSNHEITKNSVNHTQNYLYGRPVHTHSNGIINNGGYGTNLPPNNGTHISQEKSEKSNETALLTNGHLAHEDQGNGDDNKKEDKWGSLKRAGKKCSSLKNIISNKFNKTDTKLQSTGTNTQDIIDNSSKSIEMNSKNPTQHSESQNNGDNHIQENLTFQRASMYSSLKTKHEIPYYSTQNASSQVSFEKTNLPLSKHSSVRFSTDCSFSKDQYSSPEKGSCFPKRAESCSQLTQSAMKQQSPQQQLQLHSQQQNQQQQQQPFWGILRRSEDNLVRPLASDQSYPEYTKVHSKEGVSVRFQSPVEERVSGESDSGRGTGGGSATEHKGHDTSLESGSSNRAPHQGHSSGEYKIIL